MSRLSKEAWAMGLAQLTTLRSTCCRRQVGCVLLNERGHVLATGYNGVAAGRPHCNEISHWEPVAMAVEEVGQPVYPSACPGAHSKSGTDLDLCQAIHAEQNALLQCKDIYQIHTCFTTASPCMTCVKLLLNTSCQAIFFVDKYPHEDAEKLWTGAGRSWVQLTLTRTHRIKL